MSEISASTCHFWHQIFVGGRVFFLLRILHFYGGMLQKCDMELEMDFCTRW